MYVCIHICIYIYIYIYISKCAERIPAGMPELHVSDWMYIRRGAHPFSKSAAAQQTRNIQHIDSKRSSWTYKYRKRCPKFVNNHQELVFERS